jgi:type II secretory pathway component PulJ
MNGTILWALITGMISGGAWVGIVLLRRQQRRIERQPGQLEEVQRRLDHLDVMERRLAEVEERLDFTERLLTSQREERRPSPPVIGPTSSSQLPP